jgi:hypothetical protein
VQKNTNRGAWLDWMEIGTLDASEIEEALDVTARGMRDNPLTVAIFGDGSEQRRQRLRRFIGGAAGALDRGSNMLVARDADGEIAGVCNMMPPGECLRAPPSNSGCCPRYCRTGSTSPDGQCVGSPSGPNEILPTPLAPRPTCG